MPPFPSISGDFCRSIILDYICIRECIVLIDPKCIYGNVVRQHCSCIVIFVDTIWFKIPSVKNCISALRLWSVLQGMVPNKNMCFGFDFIGQSIKRDCPFILHDESVNIQCAITIIPISARLTKISARRQKHLLYRGILMAKRSVR